MIRLRRRIGARLYSAVVLLGAALIAVLQWPTALGTDQGIAAEWLLAAALVGLVGFVAWRRRASLIGRDALIECDAEGLTLVQGERRRSVAWRDIADITAIGVAEAQASEFNASRVSIRLRTPSGAPKEGLVIPDEFDPGREALAEALRRHAAAALGLAPAEAARLDAGSRTVLPDRLMDMAWLAVLVVVFLPLIVFILLGVTGVLPERWSGP